MLLTRKIGFARNLKSLIEIGPTVRPKCGEGSQPCRELEKSP